MISRTSDWMVAVFLRSSASIDGGTGPYWPRSIRALRSDSAISGERMSCTTIE